MPGEQPCGGDLGRNRGDGAWMPWKRATEGGYLADLDGDAVETRRDELAVLKQEALTRGLLQTGFPFEARSTLRDAIEANALNEEAWQLLMRAEADLDGPEAVARILVACKEALAASGLTPCQATTLTASRLRDRTAGPAPVKHSDPGVVM